MRFLAALSASALLALAAPAFAQGVSPADSGPGTNSSQPNGNPGATGGTDPKYGNTLTEGRSSVNEGSRVQARPKGAAGAPVNGPVRSGD